MLVTKQANWLFSTVLSALKIDFSNRGLAINFRFLYSFDLAAISELLTVYNVKNIGVRLSGEDLSQIPLPAIVVLSDKEMPFGVIHKFSHEHIEYSKYGQKKRTVKVRDFFAEWTSYTLLLEKTEKSGEPNYTNNRRLEFLEKVRSTAIYILSALLLIVCLWVWPTFLFPILFSIAGLGASISLLNQTLGQETVLGRAVCKAGSTTDCTKVLKSKLAKVHGDISLAEMALLFFACTMGVQVFALGMGQGYNFLLGWLYLVALPITVVSIYYQWRVLKAWCLLCLGVVACIWGLAGYYAFHFNDWQGGWPAVHAFGIGVSVPLLFWFLVRNSIFHAAKVPALEKELYKFKRSLSVFDALMTQKPAVKHEDWEGDLVLGNSAARSAITIVTNPTCGPCIRAHMLSEGWLEEHGPNLKIILRFAVNASDNGTSGKVAKHLIGMGLSHNQQLSVALHNWYSIEKPNLQDWLGSFQMDAHPDTESRLSQHAKWCQVNQITSTPTVFFNGRQVPEEFSLQDFEFFLRLKMVEAELEVAE